MHLCRSISSIITFLFLALVVTGINAEAKPTAAGQPCPINPMTDMGNWTAQEKWVWEQVCKGEIADFNKAEGYGGTLDPKQDSKWPDKRTLRPEFLETILLDETYQGAVTRHGVRITGAWFKEPLDLSNASLSHQLWLDSCRFELGVDLSSLKTFSHLSLNNSLFRGTVNLIYADIGGILNISGSKFTDKLDMNSIQAENLFMNEKAQFTDVVLIGANINSNVEMDSSKFTGKLDMNGMHAGNLLMHKEAEFKEVVLIGAKIKGDVVMVGSQFTAKLNMNGMQAGYLYMHKEAKFENVELVSAKISRILKLYGSSLASLDLSETVVGGAFMLGTPAPRWLKYAKLTLRNTHVGILEYLPNVWPDTVDLNGFTYNSLGGFAVKRAKGTAKNDLSSFKDWLGKNARYSPQPYEQLASVLSKEGYKDMAKSILYQGKRREHQETIHFWSFSWWWMAFKWVFIGYGYRIYYSIFWFFGLLGSGVFVLRKSKQGPTQGMPYGIAYSLDMLLPIIKLREFHYKIDLAGWARYYFYLHILMGYILVSFLVAGLSGLTK